MRFIPFDQSGTITIQKYGIFPLCNTDKSHNKSNSDLGVEAELLSTIPQTQQESKRSA
jgi:hypothetical protein